MKKNNKKILINKMDEMGIYIIDLYNILIYYIIRYIKRYNRIR